MKTFIKTTAVILLLNLTFAIHNSAFSQNVGISATGTTPNASAGLDVDFNNKGLLIPRMTTAERNAIPSPAHSLLIYNTTTDCYEGYNATTLTWVAFGCIGCIVPTAVTASATPNPVCAGNTLTLTGGATNATTWQWTGPNGFTSTLQSPTIANITTAGAGVYTLTASNTCGAVTPVNTASVSVLGAISATGGTITYTDASGLNPRSSPAYTGGYAVHTFTGSGIFTVTAGCGNVDYLIVAGGGGGCIGGGGGGGVLSGTTSVTAQAYNVTVGGGGSGSSAGGNGGTSLVFGISAIGGGEGGCGGLSHAGYNGACGGGGGDGIYTAGGIGSLGKNGGTGTASGGGGGGGMSVAGSNASGVTGGAGGAGISSSISGSSVYYGGGGGGGASTTGGAGTSSTGGGGTGDSAVSPTAGTANTGGGGGGGWNTIGASGGSGIVIVRYVTP